MNKIILAFTLLILFYGKSVVSAPKITLVTEHLPPYQLIHDDASVTGFATEVVLEVFKRAQIDYTLQGYPWVRTYNLALKKANHCIFSIARIPSRETLFNWIGPITEKNNAVVWGLKSNTRSQEVNTLEDLKYYTTAVNQNDVTHTGMLNIGLTEGDNLYVLHHNKSLINLLVTRNEIDFIVADDITIPHRAKLAGVDLSLLHRVIEVKNLPLNFYLACNVNTDDSITQKLAASLTQVHQDGTYNKILAKWQGEMTSLKPQQ